MRTLRLNLVATKRGYRGFTLLELMFTLTVAGILLGVGVPSFFEIIRNNRAAANINELSTAFAIARSEAIRRGAMVTVCRSSNGTACGASWADGWIAFVDNAASETAAPVVGPVLQVWGQMPGNATVATRANAVASDVAWVRFGPRGGAITSAAMPLEIRVELNGCSGDEQRRLEVNTVGRATVARAVCGS
jgi:type IV fimbrial biogenesis protein FimT